MCNCVYRVSVLIVWRVCACVRGRRPSVRVSLSTHARRARARAYAIAGRRPGAVGVGWEGREAWDLPAVSSCPFPSSPSDAAAAASCSSPPTPPFPSPSIVDTAIKAREVVCSTCFEASIVARDSSQTTGGFGGNEILPSLGSQHQPAQLSFPPCQNAGWIRLLQSRAHPTDKAFLASLAHSRGAAL